MRIWRVKVWLGALGWSSPYLFDNFFEALSLATAKAKHGLAVELY